MAKIIKSLTALKPNGEVETLAVPWLEVDDILARIDALEQGGGLVVQSGENWFRLANGIQVCWGNAAATVAAPSGTGFYVVVTLPVAYKNATFSAQVSDNCTNNTDMKSISINAATKTVSSFTAWANSPSGEYFNYVTIGYWK